MKTDRIPRKNKKKFKLMIRKSSTMEWRSKEIKLHKVQKAYRHWDKVPTIKGWSLMSHKMG